MSYASVSYTTITGPALPSFDPRIAWALRRAWRRGLALAAFALQSVIFAAVLWLILAGPGFVSARSATATPGRLIVRL